MITALSNHCTVDIELGVCNAMQVCQVLNATTEIEQLSVTTDQPILWYTPMRVLAWHAITVILIRPHEAVLAS